MMNEPRTCVDRPIPSAGAARDLGAFVAVLASVRLSSVLCAALVLLVGRLIDERRHGAAGKTACSSPAFVVSVV